MILIFYKLSFFLGGLVPLLLGSFIYAQNRKSIINKTYLGLSLSCAIWSFGFFALLSSATKDTAYIWRTFMDTGAVILPAFWMHFIYSMLGSDSKRKGEIFAYYFYGIFLIAINFIDYVVRGLFVQDVIAKNGFNYYPDAGFGYYLFILFYIVIVPYSLIYLIRNYLRSSGILAQQIKYLIIAAILGFGGGVTAFFLTFNVPVAPYGAFLFIFYPVIIAYSINKHHLFDIKVVTTELFVAALSIVALARTVIAENFQERIINGLLFISIILVGILLIRSVLKEVKQRERMEQMAKDLEVAYGVEKKAKERVEKAKAEDEALLGSIGDGVVAVDKGGEVMFVNRAAEEMLGFKSEQVIDKPYKQVLEMQNEKNEALENGKDPIYEALNSGKKIITDATNTPEKTVYFVKQDKTRFPVAVTVAPVILQGKTIGAVNVFRDVTIERQIDKSKSEFVSLASHQLRTPLTAIKWYAEMLMNKRSGTLSPKQKQYLNVIYDGDMRMIKLIDIMLSVSRLDAGKVKINNEYADIRKVAEIIIGEEQVNIKKRKQKFAFECDEKEAKTVTDPNQLRIVFQNIISNAVKYTPEGGRIVCNIKRDGDNFLFSVKDSGIGIPKDQQKRIFEKLFRADNAFSHEPDGNGLGLYAAKATIESLGGKIWFESPARNADGIAVAGGEEGKGTTFFVSVPIKR